MAMDDNDRNDDEKDSELDILAQQELLRLTRQYRVMEGDKEAYLEEVSKALRRQRKTISDLDDEKKQLERSISVSRSKQNLKKDGENAAKLSELTEEQENLQNFLQRERSAINDLDNDIQRVERQIGQQHRMATLGSKAAAAGTGSSKTPVRERRDIGQRIVLLENRLDGVMVQFNATLAQNTNVRTEIDHLVQERATFNDMIAKLHKKIAANKKTIADITEMAILAFDQRDEAQSKISAFQERNEKDAMQYAAELKELQRTLDHDEKLKDFLFHKSNDRAFAADLAEEDRDRERKEAQAKNLEHSKQYKEAFDKIKKVVASDSNLDKIVADFIKVEDQNFALFNYVTEMNNQVEGLQESISKLRSDIKEAKGRGDERERQQREQLTSMERKVDSSIREADATEGKLELMEAIILKLKIGTEELYMGSKCGATPVLSLLGATNDVTVRPNVNENNIVMYLDMVHEKIIELKVLSQYLDSQTQTQKTKDRMKDADPLLGSSLEKNKMAKKMPSSAALLGRAEEEDNTDEYSNFDNVRPFEMDALKARAFKVSMMERQEEIAISDMAAMTEAAARKSKSKQKGK